MTEYTESIRELEEHRQKKNDAALQAAKETCETCTRCALCQTRTKIWYTVQEVPRHRCCSSEKRRVPKRMKPVFRLWGAAGKLLDRYLFAMDIPRSAVYIANILKCRPPHNRDPLGTEQDACIGYLRKQTKLLNPKIIVCLGRIAAMKLIREDFRISRDHGTWEQKGGIWFTAMYHPSALLRDVTSAPIRSGTSKACRQKRRALHAYPIKKNPSRRSRREGFLRSLLFRQALLHVVVRRNFERIVKRL